MCHVGKAVRAAYILSYMQLLGIDAYVLTESTHSQTKKIKAEQILMKNIERE